MAKTKLNLRPLTSVPRLMMAEVATHSGGKLVALSTEPNSVHFHSLDDSIGGLGGVVFVGPDVRTIAMDWGKIVIVLLDLAHKVLDSDGGGGGGGQKCTSTTTVTTDASGKVTGTSTTWACAPL